MFTMGEKLGVLVRICEVYHYDFTYTEEGKIVMKSDSYGNVITYENINEALFDWEYTLVCNDMDNDDDFWEYEIAFIRKNNVTSFR